MKIRARMQGLTLIELLVAMMLGIFVVGGVLNLTLANRQSYRTNEGLSQLQESARTAFELLARDFRQAGLTGCDNVGRVSNVLDTTLVNYWWMSWFGIRGHDDTSDSSAVIFGTAVGQRVANTDAVQLQGIEGIPLSVESHAVVGTDANMIFRAGAAAYPAVGDVLVACDFDHAAVFQVTAFDSTLRRARHNTGAGSPGNCSRGLGFPTVCTAGGTPHLYAANSLVARMYATDWYIGQNGRVDEGGRSLYRRRLTSGGLVTEEIVAGVTDMQITYRRGTDTTFTAPGAWTAAQWNDVNAVRIVLDVETADTRISTDATVNSGRISREFSQVVTLRNRVP